MDKTKTYDKHADINSRAGQPGDMSWWQREMFKKLVAGGSLDSDIPAPPYLSSMPWPYPQHSWSHPLFQHLAHSAMPQSPGETHEQEKEHEGQQGGTEPSPSDKSQPSHSSETSGPSAGTGRYPFHSASADSNYDDLHNMGGTRPPYSYPGGFIFPSPPFPGQLDPLMLWMHHMRRQAAYLYSMPGCRNGYQSPLPVPSAGANQRGFIKIPAGIPQKQTQLWETQSSENMQLWATITQLCATVARAEAEIFCQRGKISKLEDELQIMKTRQDALSEALKCTTVSQVRRERRKRTATVPVAILGLPASQPLPARAQVKKARGSMSEADSLKPTSEIASEGNCEQAHQNNALALTNGSTQNGNGCSSRSVGLNQSESRHDAMDKDMVERQRASTDSSCVGMINSSNRGSLPAEMTRETCDLQIMEIKQECITDSMTNEADRPMEGADFDGKKDSMTNEADRPKEGADFDWKKDEARVIESNTKQTLYSGDCCRDNEVVKRDAVCITENEGDQRADAVGASIKSEISGMAKRDDRLEGVAIASTGDSIHGGLLSNANSLARPNAINSGNAVADWHHALQNGQVGASAERDKEAEAINTCTLDGFDGNDEWTQEVMEVLK